MKVGTMTMLTAVAAFACQQSATPVAPDLVTEESFAATASMPACPCWDEARLATALPAVHLFSIAEGAASLSRFDHDNAQQIQALVSSSPSGGGSCELASFGTSGRIEAFAAAEGLSASQCEACGSMLTAAAARAGLATLAIERKPAE